MCVIKTILFNWLLDPHCSRRLNDFTSSKTWTSFYIWGLLGAGMAAIPDHARQQKNVLLLYCTRMRGMSFSTVLTHLCYLIDIYATTMICMYIWGLLGAGMLPFPITLDNQECIITVRVWGVCLYVCTFVCI
jgi:hypothetical protein